MDSVRTTQIFLIHFVFLILVLGISIKKQP